MTSSIHDPGQARDDAKRRAGEHAAGLVEDGMRLGLGTGSTAFWFIEAVGRRVADGLRVNAVATSGQTAVHAHAVGIPLVDLPAEGLDLAVDGADCVDGRWNLIKGGGGAHVRERIVAASARRFVVIVDWTKLRAQLGGLLPLEIVEFGWERTLRLVGEICGAAATPRHAPGRAVRLSDSGNVLADVPLPRAMDWPALAARLDAVPGLVGHGLFLGMATDLVVGREGGGVDASHGPAPARVEGPGG